jgi:uncharacterized membrane protein
MVQASPGSSPAGHGGRWARLHPSTRILFVEVAAIVVAMALLGAAGHPLILSHPLHRFLHILGAILFLGNVLVTALWLSLLARLPEPGLVRHAAEATQWADVAFTAPGVFLIISNGMILVTAIGGLAAHPWAAWGLGLFAASGVLWLLLLIPVQERMVRIATAAESAGSPLGQDFRNALRQWTIVGIIATILPLVTLGLMVFKPGIG